ncbi:hypothetical protein AKJ56_01570 [candidate division MSBL1 archaeon SCGC-AAA382N08]|uniref:HicB-like antitoxin of toxin-antitoxin system domain-containing protein n=1 Tax=candidate division MSBL1 archaeon SCGC-AAA382N08 TaxID=1698285 RepID=A0A133VPH4_9EURY|nr:hypothetical protein AKJ56_01570 [candidate division MSBL1 archaeon SCGC-AAA382N08]
MVTGLKNPTEKAPYLLWREDDMWIAKDVETGVASQGKTRQEALKNLDDAVVLYRKETDESVDTTKEERETLEELGIGLDKVKAREENDEFPEFLR